MSLQLDKSSWEVTKTTLGRHVQGIYFLHKYYWCYHYEPLKNLFESHENATKFDTKEQNELYGLNVWIIYVVGEKGRNNLLEVLKKSPLRFDSNVFEFFDSNGGKIKNIVLTLYI